MKIFKSLLTWLQENLQTFTSTGERLQIQGYMSLLLVPMNGYGEFAYDSRCS